VAGTEPSGPRRRGPIAVFKAVAWSFLGIRRKSEHESDAVNLTPAQVIAAGLVAAALFVALLIFVVRIVISNAAA
jgi:preprotein translocase subunit Sec61beta